MYRRRLNFGRVMRKETEGQVGFCMRRQRTETEGPGLIGIQWGQVWFCIIYKLKIYIIMIITYK